MKKRILFLSILAVLLLSITCIGTNYYNANYINYNVSPYSSNSLLNLLLGMMLFIYAILFVLLILRIIALCFIFDSAGQAWWKALIPIYNAVVFFKIIDLSPWLLLSELFFVSIYYTDELGEILCICIILVLGILSSIKLAKAFGKSGTFTLGLIFLPTIFYCILAFGDSKYQLINEQDKLFNINSDENNIKENSKKSKKDEYIVVDPETGEEINPDFYKPMDLTDYKPRSDFFK